MILLPVLLVTGGVWLVFLYLQYRWRNRRFLEAASKLPCPPTLPFLGNAHLLTGNYSDVLKTFTVWANRFKGLYCCWIGPTPMIIVSNQADVKIVLNNSRMLEKGFTYGYIRPYMGQGLITGHVPIWKKHRRLISPMFTSSNIVNILPLFNSVGVKFARTIDKMAGKGPIDYKNLIRDTVLYASIETILGLKFAQCKITSVIPFIWSLLEWTGEVPLIRMFNPMYYSDKVFKCCYYRVLKHASRCISSLHPIIHKAIKEYQVGKESGDSKNWISLLDVWDAATSGTFQDDHWSEEVITLIGAGTDTTISTVYFMLATLASNPDVQDKVYSEIRQVLGSHEEDLTISELNAMTYLGHAITENMRIHGIVPMIGRHATKDTKLSNFTIPAGSDVLILLHAMGWDPEVFSEPEKYIPERFLVDENEGLSRKFIPFSDGPRACIGKTYAIILIKCIMVHILMKYKLVTEENLQNVERTLYVVKYPTKPLLIDFQSR